MNVKVCGVTRLEDAELAVELGAWAVGMVFYEPSPRRCSLAAAQSIASTVRRRVELCGVFVNATLGEIEHAAEELELTLVQLHGDEGPSFCAEVARRTGARVIKAVQVRVPGDVREVERFHVDFHLLDARASAPERRELRGGTGESFDWSLLSVRRSKTPLILSGGLGPENVAEAIQTAEDRRAGLFAVDTASGTEAAPGVKDPGRLRELFAQVRRVSVVSPA
ncbi:MAG TPA: phosphoribosylanthranilate isomerase [Solirubrobacteraceae bacterium]|jgi:phosphoribosylanthranilate isomerase|nr:phosphoribosylanthranilate isomerase [Solirubrobacteraceae bacterium]